MCKGPEAGSAYMLQELTEDQCGRSSLENGLEKGNHGGKGQKEERTREVHLAFTIIPSALSSFALSVPRDEQVPAKGL